MKFVKIWDFAHHRLSIKKKAGRIITVKVQFYCQIRDFRRNLSVHQMAIFTHPNISIYVSQIFFFDTP